MDPKEDEEISIDFGRIKKFFKIDKKEDDKKIDENIKAIEDSAKVEKEDDDIAIDFSKIKNLFKGEKKEETKAGHTTKDDDDMELSFDFGKVTKFFKSSKEEIKEIGEEISVNWGNLISFFKKYGIIFIALIPIVLSIYVRMQAGFLPITDDWAVNSVINGIKSQIRSGIDQQYPNLPDANKNALVDTELQKVLSQSKGQIDEQIKATSNYFKAFFQDESG